MVVRTERLNGPRNCRFVMYSRFSSQATDQSYGLCCGHPGPTKCWTVKEAYFQAAQHRCWPLKSQCAPTARSRQPFSPNQSFRHALAPALNRAFACLHGPWKGSCVLAARKVKCATTTSMSGTCVAARAPPAKACKQPRAPCSFRPLVSNLSAQAALQAVNTCAEQHWHALPSLSSTCEPVHGPWRHANALFNASAKAWRNDSKGCHERAVSTHYCMISVASFCAGQPESTFPSLSST